MTNAQFDEQTSEQVAAPPPSDSPIVFFDGVCGLCNHFVTWVIDRDRHGVIRFAPLQGKTASLLLDRRFREELKTVVFLHNGRATIRTGAVCRILRSLGGVWWLVGSLIWMIPWFVRDLGYRFVASVRYVVFGKLETCRMPRPGEQQRFLD